MSDDWLAVEASCGHGDRRLLIVFDRLLTVFQLNVNLAEIE